MRYTVQHRYTASRDGQTFGPWDPGTEVELDEPDADWVNRDSEGTLKPVDAAPELAPEPSAPEPAPVTPEAEPEPAPTKRGRGRSSL